MADHSIFSDFKEIFTAWNVGKSELIVFDLIVNWIKNYKDIIPYKDIINSLQEEINTIEDIEEFVEKFIYGDNCMILRISYLN